MPTKLRDDDMMDTFEPSGSEDDFDETEKELLSKVRNRKNKYSDSEEEVYNLEDDDNRSDLALSDVEGQESDDGLPDVRAWGKQKKKYYSTDYVDPDYGGFQGKDAHLAELEEEEARNLQKQLAQQLDDDDFSLDVFAKKPEEDKKQVEEIIKTDISKLSKRQKLQILQKESPEFFGLVEDFQAKMLIAKDYLNPILKRCKTDRIPQCKAVDFVQTQYELILNYCVNIYMYLLLKASKVNIQNHPIVKRLFQYRQLLSELEPVFQDIIKPQIEIMLQEMKHEEKASERKKTLKLLSSLTKKDSVSKEKRRVAFEDDSQPSKKVKFAIPDEESEEKLGKNVITDDSDSSSGEEEKEDKDEGEQKVEGVEKRGITYKMAKNKGLTPYKKKELRNPRVKHKLKYRKALIRRKGAVREPRKELTRYGGEISGIKSTVTKSIKFK